MNEIFIKTLKLARRLNTILTQKESAFGQKTNMISNKEYSNELIYNLLESENPCMISRFGATEMLNLITYLGVKENNRSFRKFIKEETLQWWWEEKFFTQLNTQSGFFPPTKNMVERFCELMISDIKEIDILGSWLKEEKFFQKELSNVKYVTLEDLEPFFCKNPWTKALHGKNILVVHPFAETIERQYENRQLLFEKNLLPEFNLETVKAVQSAVGEKSDFDNWFDALESMKIQIDKHDYDVCIIGCGAYGLSLAAHVKRNGKKAIHLAGATQLLFGIKGKRWEEYTKWPYKNLFNEHWIRPDEKDRPANANILENACYW